MNEKILVMEPEVSSVPESAITSYESTKLGVSDPVDSAWVMAATTAEVLLS